MSDAKIVFVCNVELDAVRKALDELQGEADVNSLSDQEVLDAFLEESRKELIPFEIDDGVIVTSVMGGLVEE